MIRGTHPLAGLMMVRPSRGAFMTTAYGHEGIGICIGIGIGIGIED